MPVIPLPPNAPHQTMGHSYPNSSIPMPPKLSFPTSQQLHCFRHNPVNAKQSKYHKPQIKSNRAMDKEVWSTDSSFLLHIQLQSKIKIFRFLRLSIVNIPQSCSPNKKSNSRRDLRLPNSLPRKRLIETFCQNLVIRTNNKTSSHSRFPTHFIIPNSSRRSSINSRH